jgi:hypothetical protein
MSVVARVQFNNLGNAVTTYVGGNQVSASFGTSNAFFDTLTPWVVEDPDPNYDRTWLNDRGHTNSTLVPIFGSINSLYKIPRLVSGPSAFWSRPGSGFNFDSTGPAAPDTAGYNPNLFFHGQIYTNKGMLYNANLSTTVRSSGTAINDMPRMKAHYETWFLSLDPNFYPAKHTWESVNGNFLSTDKLRWSILTSGNNTSYNSTIVRYHRSAGDFNNLGSFMTTNIVSMSPGGAFNFNMNLGSYTVGALGNAGFADFPDVWFYENASTQYLYGLSFLIYGSPRVAWQAGTGYDTLTPSLVAQNSVTGGNQGFSYQQFIGPDNLGNTYWYNNYYGPFHRPTTSSSRHMTIWRLNASAQSSTILQLGHVFGNADVSYATQNFITNPSNIRRASATRYVMYQPDLFTTSVFTLFNATDAIGAYTGSMWYRRVVFDPTTGSFTHGTCTWGTASTTLMNWNFGTTVLGNNNRTGRGFNVGTLFTNGAGNHSVLPTNGHWRLKPYQWTMPSGNNYITMFGDNSAVYANTSGPRGTTGTVSAANGYTVQINSEDDSILSFHSECNFGCRSWMPIGDYQDQVVVLGGPNQDNRVYFYRFFETTANTGQIGWNLTSTYNVSALAVGVDSYSRVWVSTQDPSGNNAGLIHLVTPWLPVTFNIATPNISFSYTGTEISSNVTINSYNYLGDRINVPVTLQVGGNNMIFTSNSSTILTSNTDSTQDTVIPVTITGPGNAVVFARASTL